MAHDVSDADPVAAPAAEPPAVDAPLVPVDASAAQVGEPAIAVRAVEGLAPQWGAPRPRPANQPRRKGRDPHATRRPAVGLSALILTALVAAFFGWVSAEPFWLATGRGTAGTATITSCDTACVGDFRGGEIVAEAVRISSVPTNQRRAGATFDARMLDAGSTWAYAGPTSGLTLRWILGAVVVLLCGLLVGFLTGVHRLRRVRRGARFVLWLVGLAGPLAIYAGILTAAAL